MLNIIIKVDIGESNFLYSINEILDDEIADLTVVIDAIDSFENYEVDGILFDSNFPIGESLDVLSGEKGIEELYIKTEKCSFEQMKLFRQYIPESQFGVLSVKSVWIVEILDENILL